MKNNEAMIEKTNPDRISGNWVVWNTNKGKVELVSQSEPTNYYMRGYKVLPPLKKNMFKRTLPREFAFPSAFGLGVDGDMEA